MPISVQFWRQLDYGFHRFGSTEALRKGFLCIHILLLIISVVYFCIFVCIHIKHAYGYGSDLISRNCQCSNEHCVKNSTHSNGNISLKLYLMLLKMCNLYVFYKLWDTNRHKISISARSIHVSVQIAFVYRNSALNKLNTRNCLFRANRHLIYAFLLFDIMFTMKIHLEDGVLFPFCPNLIILLK